MCQSWALGTNVTWFVRSIHAEFFVFSVVLMLVTVTSKKSVASMDHGLPSRLYHNLATQDWSIVGNILSVCFITWSHTEELEQWLLPRWCWLWWLLVQKLAAAKDLWRGSSIIAVAAGNAFTGFPAMQRFEEFATRCVQLLVLGSMWSCWKLGLQPGYL
jgi:hypothetical protein